jgi:hypothetical protein
MQTETGMVTASDGSLTIRGRSGEASSIFSAIFTRGVILTVVLCAAGCGQKQSDDFESQVQPIGADHHIGANGRDFCIPLDEPVWKSVAESSFMRSDDPVIGITTEKASYAIPWWVLKNHHVANFVADGEEILVTLCERCSSAAAFSPVVDGKRLTYQVVGIYNGTHILRDHETRTFWLPFLGIGMNGVHKGRHLQRRRVDQATWADWLELHPGTFVAFEVESARAGHGSEDSPGSEKLGGKMLTTLQHTDGRLGRNELLLGVMVDGHERAYSMAALTANGVVLQEQLGNASIVVFHKPQTYMAAAFIRTVNGEMLDFTLNDQGRIVDQKTGSIWNLAGEAIEGPLSGTKLKACTYSMEEWYIWYTQHPLTTVYSK